MPKQNNPTRFLDKYPDCVGCPVSKYCGTCVSSVELCYSFQGEPDKEGIQLLEECYEEAYMDGLGGDWQG